MNSETPPLLVLHNQAASRFETSGGAVVALCEYRREGGRMIFTHTFVPPELRGQGVAERLVRPALEFARAERLQVVPACSYVAKFVERHAEFQMLLEPRG